MAEGWTSPRHKRAAGDWPVRGDRAGRELFDTTVADVERLRAELEVEAAAIRAAIARLRARGEDEE